jgi:hypothetical protein
MKFEDMTSVAKLFIESKLFKDVTSVAAAVVKIQAGQEVGVAPFAAMSGIYIIQGKVALGGGVIASRIKASGKYNYKVKTMTDALVEVEFFEKGEPIGISSFSIEDAKKQGTQNIQKFPRNMLFNRAISNGVKWFCPDVFDGPVYVEGEIPTETVDVQHEVVKEIVGGDSPRYSTVYNAIVEQGYSFEQVESKYNLTAEAKGCIQQAVDAKNEQSQTAV